MTKVKHKINPNSKVRVRWIDKHENYSRTKERDIIKHIKNKYGVKTVVVDFQSTNSIKLGAVDLENGEVENINKPEIQEKIMVDWLKENKIDIEISDIKRLNKRVENELGEIEVKDNKIIVKSLSIQNFLSYGEEPTMFDFEKLKGITLIQGENFSGKTTVIQALIWLLFGSIPKAKKQEDVINKYNGATSCKVEGEFNINGVEYKIVREVKRKYVKKTDTFNGSSSSLRILTQNASGEFVEQDKEEDRKATEKVIKEHIGNLNDFLMTVVATGDNIFDIIKTKPTERGEMLSRYLGLEVFKRKLDVVKEIYKQWKVKADVGKYSSVELQQEIDDNLTLLETYKDEKRIKEEELYTNNSETDKLNVELEELLLKLYNDIDNSLVNLSEDYFDSITKEVTDKINNKKIEINKLKEELKEDIGDFNEEKYNKNLDVIAALENDIQNITNVEIGNLNNQLMSINNQINSIENEKNEKIRKFEDNINNEIRTSEKKLNDEIREVENEKNEKVRSLENKRNEHTTKVREIETTITFLNRDMDTLRVAIKNLKEGDKCPECGQKLSDVDHTDVIKEKIAEGLKKKADVEEQEKLIIIENDVIEKIGLEISELEEKFKISKQYAETSFEKNKKTLEDKIIVGKKEIYDEYVLLKEKHDNEILTIKGNIEKSIEKITEIKLKIDEIKAENQELYKTKELVSRNDIIKVNIDKLEVEIELLENELVKNNDRLNKYKQDKDKIIKNRETNVLINEKKYEITKKGETRSYIQRELNMTEQKISDILVKNENLDKLITKIRREEHNVKVFEVYMNMVGKDGISKSILRSSVPLLNMELNRLLKDSAEFTVEIDINDKNNEVEFWLVDNETGIKGYLDSGSGYEQTIAALAIRVVNSKINTLPKPSLLLMDEIFSTVSNSNLELVKIFLDKVSGEIENIFLITHNELTKEWADNIITITKENNVSKAQF